MSLTATHDGVEAGTYFPSVMIAGAGALDGTYSGWCADPNRWMANGPAMLYSTYDSAAMARIATLLDPPTTLSADALPLANYIVNHYVTGTPIAPMDAACNPDPNWATGAGNMWSIQQALWYVLAGRPLEANDPWAQAIVCDAAANGAAFVPACGQLVLIWALPVDAEGSVAGQSVLPAFEVGCPAPRLETATLTTDCEGFTLTVSGKLCGSGSVAYGINLMPSTGGSVALPPGTLPVAGDANCDFSATTSGTWPSGVSPVGATFNGSATLGASTICFPPDGTSGSFACGQEGGPVFEEPVACQPPSSKTVSIGPSSMEGAIKISNGDWVSGGYSLKSTVTGDLTVAAKVTITGPCSNGGTDTVTIPLATGTYAAPVTATGWLPTGDANSVVSWQGSVRVGVTSPPVCGGVGKLDASKGAVFTATVSASPPQPGALVTFRFKFRDPAAKGKPNTNCLDTSDPNRNRADVCGASWSATKTFDP